jgi:hypothetical protein
MTIFFVIPAEAGIHGLAMVRPPPDQTRGRLWTPACAGVTDR